MVRPKNIKGILINGPSSTGKTEIPRDLLRTKSISTPLQYRISQLVPRKGSKAGLSIRRPNIEDHPRTYHCVQLLKNGVTSMHLHGYDSLESTIKIFSEHGIPFSDKWYQICFNRMLNLTDHLDQYYRGIGKPGRILDERRCGGSGMIRAASLARTGLEDESLIEAEISEAIDVFTSLLKIDHPEEIMIPYKDKWVIREKMAIPSYYHLLILAFTRSWRTPQNIQRLRKVVECLPSLPDAYIKNGSQIIAPAQLHATMWFRPDSINNDIYKAQWIDRAILLLKAEIVSGKLKGIIKRFMKSSFQEWVKEIHNSSPFLKWGAYTGIGLEPNWKSGDRKYIDLLFRYEEINQLLSPNSKTI